MLEDYSFEAQVAEANRHIAYFTQQTAYMLSRKIYWEQRLSAIQEGHSE